MAGSCESFFPKLFISAAGEGTNGGSKQQESAITQEGKMVGFSTLTSAQDHLQ